VTENKNRKYNRNKAKMTNKFKKATKDGGICALKWIALANPNCIEEELSNEIFLIIMMN
jgi:hypothetical protein